MTRYIRLDTKTRDRLRELRIRNVSYTETLAALLGKWNHNPPDVDVNVQIAERGAVSNENATTIRVSDGCHDMLSDIQREMGVSSVGAAVEILVANWM